MNIWNNRYKTKSCKLSLISCSNLTRKSIKMTLRQLSRKELPLSLPLQRRNRLMLKSLPSLHRNICRLLLPHHRPRIREKVLSVTQREVEDPKSRLREFLRHLPPRNSKNQRTTIMMTILRCPLPRAKHRYNNTASFHNSAGEAARSTKPLETTRQ